MAKHTLKDQWHDLNEPHERLVWARMYWQERAGAVNGTAKDAADSLAMRPNTYGAYERPPHASKHTKLNHQAAIKFARKFKVSWLWLLLGEGTPFDDQLPPAQERVVQAMAKVDQERQDALANMIEALLGDRKAS